MLCLDHVQKPPRRSTRKGPQTQPQGLALAAQGQEFAHAQGQTAVHYQLLRHIGHAGLALKASKLDASRIGHFANKAEQQRGLARPVGAHKNRAAASGRGGADIVQNKIAPPAEAYILKADRGGKQAVICQSTSLTWQYFLT